MKYDPSVVEIPIPRYFKEDDRINTDIIFKSQVERGKKKKAVKRRAKKGKKGKKKKAELVKPEIITAQMKEQWIDKELELTYETALPVKEVTRDPYLADMAILQAIMLIQRNERGRQGLDRYLLFSDGCNN
jgi:hypothetical protein